MTIEDMFDGSIRTMWGCPVCDTTVWQYRECVPCDLHGLCKECGEEHVDHNLEHRGMANDD